MISPRMSPTLAAMVFMVSSGALAQDAVVETEAGPVSVSTVAGGLSHPWGLAFLPEGRMLVTERDGRMRIVDADGALSDPLGGLPEIWVSGQGGLLNVALSPDFETSGVVFFTFSAPDGGDAGTAVARGQLVEDGDGARLANVETIFSMNDKDRSGRHFAGRMSVAGDGTLFFAIGDRGTMERSQDFSDHAGNVLRINPDGSIPDDNPFVGDDGVADEIWSTGHRNIQGMAIHPETGVLWTHEHGPRGGDEINIPQPGENFGWPIVTYGIDYSGATIGEGIQERDDLVGPLHHWTPSIAPSGLAFYQGDAFPDWQGDMLVGALAGSALHRVRLDGEEVVGEEVMLTELGERIRDVRLGPDGLVYLLTDAGDGRILRLSPGG